MSGLEPFAEPLLKGWRSEVRTRYLSRFRSVRHRYLRFSRSRDNNAHGQEARPVPRR